MKRGDFISGSKIVTLVVLCGACAACDGGALQTLSTIASANYDNNALRIRSLSGIDASPEQRNRDIVQSVTGRTM